VTFVASFDRYESVAWIPNIVTLLVMLGVGGKHLIIMPGPAPVSTGTLLSYSSTVTSSVLSWSTIAPDYGVYHCGKASRSVLFGYECITMMTIEQPPDIHLYVFSFLKC
jgi:purine-cytosine permease-like protein